MSFLGRDNSLPVILAGAVLGGVLLLFAIPTAGEEKAPPGILVLARPDSEFPHSGALPALLSRALDTAGLRHRPVSLPEGLRQNLGHILSESDDKGFSGQVGTYLRSEAREYAIQSILLIDAREMDGRIGISLSGFQAPFDSAWVVAAPREPISSLPSSFAYLARRTAERLGPGKIRREKPPLYDMEAEDSYARALSAGSLRLLNDAIECDASHHLARSELGFRLLLGRCRVRAVDHLRAVDGDELPSPFRELHAARFAYAEGDDEGFRASLDRLREVLPERAETLSLEGIASMEEGKWEEARESFRQALAGRPLDPLLHSLLAEASLRDGYLEAAQNEYGRALSLDPENALAQIGLASTLHSEGRIDEAQRILARLEPPDPHGPEGTRPHFLLRAAQAGLLTSQGKFGAAAADLAHARKEAHRLGDGESLLDLTVRLFYTLVEAGEVDKASEELSELRFRRDDPFWDARGAGLLSYYEGLLGVHRGDFGTVMAKRLELETTAQSDPILQRLLDGQYYLLRGSGWEASLPLREALEERETSLLHHWNGRAALLSERFGIALRELEWVADRGEYLLDLPLVLSINFFYLGRAFELWGDEHRAKMAYGEFLHYWRWSDDGRPESLHALNYMRQKD